MQHPYLLAARAAHFWRWTLAAAALLLALLPGHALATVYYVDAGRADNSGNGLSWATAKKDLQEALNLATIASDEVWVKTGTYRPTLVPPTSTTGTTARDVSFYLLDTDLKLYGGFSGTEIAASQRNPASFPTTLSGDVDGSTSTRDAYHVLLTVGRTSACVVDGFTIRRGGATVPGSISVQSATGSATVNSNVGGGMSNVNSSPTVSTCIFNSNSANSTGGGMNNVNSSPTVNYCTFSGNNAINFGGGMNSSSSSSPTVSNCIFSGNTAGIGGGMNNTSSNSTVSNCTFNRNSAISGGTGGGGMNNVNSSLTVSNCTFSSNSANVNGGGMYNQGGSLTVNNCIFNSNSANSTGGGISSRDGSLTVSNCLFSSNSSDGTGGGGMYNDGTLTMSSCTLIANSATSTSGTGGGLYCTSNNGGSLTNCILYQNTTPNNRTNPNREELYKAGNFNELIVSYCIIRDAAGTAPNLTVANATLKNCYTDAPGYVDPTDADGPDNIWATADDGLRLSCASFATDKGTGSTPATDILGNPRKGLMDLGAYEATGGTAATNAIPDATTTVSGVQPAAVLPYTDCQHQLLQLDATSPYTLLGSTIVTVRVLPTAPVFNTQLYVRRTYDIVPVANAATATAEVTLYFTQADFDDYNTARGTRPALPLSATDPDGYAANLRITQQHGRSATGDPGSYTGWAGTGTASVFITPTAVAYNATAARWEVRFPVTGFSGFFAHTVASPLPIELTAFTAMPAGTAAVRLAWATASEQNSQAFEAERSLDGRTFVPLGTVAAAGNSSAPRRYALLDTQLPAGATKLYYRLKQVDLDGTFSYSPVRTVARLGAAKGLNLYPNPATGAATLTGAAPGTVVTVFDALGRPVASAPADATGAAALRLPAGLAPGVYVVRAGTQALRLTVE